LSIATGVTADSALAFAEAFGMEAEFWLNLQRDWDLWRSRQTCSCEIVISCKKKEGC